MNCTTLVNNGSNPDCINYLKEAKFAIVMKAGTAFPDAAALDNIENLRALIQEENSATIIEFNGTEPTAPEVASETTGFGTTFYTNESAPTLLGYAKTNACDFKDLLQSFYESSAAVILGMADKRLLCFDAGTQLQGFDTQMWAHAYGAPGRENSTQLFKITLNFLDEVEWRSPEVVPVNYTLNDLKLLLPLGLKAYPSVGTLAAGQAEIAVSVRCVANSGLTEALEAEVLNTNAEGVSILPTYNATTGKYDCLVQKTGAVDLVAGEYVEGRLILKSGAIYEKISNVVKFQP